MPTPWSVVGNPTHGAEEEDEEQVGVFVLPEREEEEEDAAAKAKQLRTRRQQAARGFDPWPHLPNEIKASPTLSATLNFSIQLFYDTFLL
jgi:hypothetical protein